MDVESYEEGYLAAIITPDGGVAPVGAPVGVIVESESEIGLVDASSFGAGAAPAAAAAPAPAPAPAAAAPAAAAAAAPVVNSGRVEASGWAKTVAAEKGIDLATVSPSRTDGLITARDLAGAAPASSSSSSWTPAPGVINATPMAKKYAKENGLDVASIKGTGNFNRVTADDVLIAAGKKALPAPAAPASAAPAAPAATIPAKKEAAVEAPVLDGVVAMNGMQKAVAKNMEKTLEVPIFRVSREIVTDDFDALYAQLKPKGITVSAMLAKAVAEVLKKHPIVNAAYVEGGIKYNKVLQSATTCLTHRKPSQAKHRLFHIRSPLSPTPFPCRLSFRTST